MSWTVIVPVKRLDVAKSRLRGALPGVDHDSLVLAMAMDTVAAAVASRGVGRVVVITSDPRAAEAVRGVSAEVVLDVPDAGLNPALAYAATHLRARSANPPGMVALAADLPALRSDDLTDALRVAESMLAGPSVPRRGFVTDSAGTGTVLLAAAPGVQLEPCFGAGSASAHASSGAATLTGSWPSLRRDVDTAADFAEAVVLGVGSRTAALMARQMVS